MDRVVRWLAALVAASAFACLAGLIDAGAAAATADQETMLADNGQLLANPAGTVQRLRLLGVERIRLFLIWSRVAPHAGSRHRPSGFHADDPAAYPASAWAPWDDVIRAASAAGIGIDLDVAGGAPLWATGPGAPRGTPHPNWQPSAREYESFVRALGKRYSGTYNPEKRRSEPGSDGDLPAVRFWSIWNEPDYGPSLAPQGVPGNLKVEHSPSVYRGLVDAGWRALHATGHGHDTIVWGELAPRGAAYWGVFSGMKPIPFLRVMYCLDPAYRPLRGTAARLRGCSSRPLSAGAFRRAHPALFEASGVSVHPYMRWYQPNHEAQYDPDYATFGEFGTFERALDRLQVAYHSPTRFPIYNTEFGYITSPPKHDSAKHPYLAPDLAALYMNWAEYLSWRSRRVRSYMQYLLADSQPPSSTNDWGGFASGLLSFSGRQKPTYSAFRLPLFLPIVTQPQHGSLEVWGAARPAHFAQLDTGAAQVVEIQFAPRGSSKFSTIAAVTVDNPRGYFDTRASFPRSGTVRLQWTYPLDDLGFAPGYRAWSRPVSVTVR